jgi:hypothetical protein
MPRHITYGEVAYKTFCGLDPTLLNVTDYQQIPEQFRDVWENTAAAVIAEFRKRQAELSHQGPPDPEI